MKENNMYRGLPSCYYAAKNNQRDLLLWLKENGFRTNGLCEIAAADGNLDLLKWARENDYPWNDRVCMHVVDMRRNISILKWARDNGCPWDPHTRNQAWSRFDYTDNYPLSGRQIN
jgi:hypothetical protein